MAVIDFQKVGDQCLMPTQATTKIGIGDFDSCEIRQDNNWRVDYIPFMPNGINCCRLTVGWEALSFNFSGCPFVVWEDQGQFFAGHVSTGDGQDCKQRWINARGQFTRYAEFLPHKYIVGRPTVAIQHMYGLVSLRNGGNNICFSTIGVSVDKTGNRAIDQWHMFDVEWGHTEI